MRTGFNLVRFITKQKIIKSLHGFKALEYYPPFLFMGVKIVQVSSDYKRLHAILPLRWFGSNPHGTIFGGFMAALADPLPAIMCGKIFPDTEGWTQALSIYFKRPGYKQVHLKIQITEEDIQKIKEELSSQGKSRYTFACCYEDDHGKTVAEIENTVYLRNKRR